MEKFQEIWRSFKRFGVVSRDLKSFKVFEKVSRDFEKFYGIWRRFEGLEKFQRISKKVWKSFEGFSFDMNYV